MAPPKRKTGGRVTPAGTRPNETSRASSGAGSTAKKAKSAGSDDGPSYASSGRYTAPTSTGHAPSPQWVPVVMLALFVFGGLAIMARYLFWDSNIPMVVGMVGLLGGLFLATRWR